MAEHSEDGRLLVVDKRTGETYREHQHVIDRAPNLEYAPSTKAKLKAKAEADVKAAADAKAKADAETANRAKTNKNQGS